MLTQVDITTASGDVLSLVLEDYSNGFAVHDIAGLDPVKATIVTSSFAQLDGVEYHNSRREMRNIVLKLGLYPDYITTQIADLRATLYNYMMPKSAISLKFYDDSGLTVSISGRVESFGAPLFSKGPEVDVSIICFNPDFLDLVPTVIAGNTVASTTMSSLTYNGTVETGVVLTLNANRSLSAFTIYHLPPDGTLRQFDFAASLVAADVVTVNTKVGAKGLTLLRGGTTSSLLYGVSPQSNWISLQKGVNQFRVYAVGAAIPYTIAYAARYGGL